MTTRAEISYDLVMEDDMQGVCEGTFRLPKRNWQVLIFVPDVLNAPEIDPNATWKSGVTGIFVRWPRGEPLRKRDVERVLSAAYGVDEWVEVEGPDSIQLR